MVIVVHGGAGRVAPELEEAVLEGVAAARDRGWRVLAGGGSAVEAAVAAVAYLEDHPLFNAGTGSALNRQGFVEADAAVMDGATLGFGGVAGVRDVKNPIRLAREVLDAEPVLLAGEGASLFARERGIPAYDPAALVTERALERWREARRRKVRGSGTVGAVALDARGRLAAATSTGGLVDKPVGRVGDTPLVGAGTYAEAGLGAASATGEGEYLARALVAFRAVAGLAELGPEAAARRALERARTLGGEGGLILLATDGRFAAVHTSPQMSHAWRSPKGEGAALS